MRDSQDSGLCRVSATATRRTWSRIAGSAAAPACSHCQQVCLLVCYITMNNSLQESQNTTSLVLLLLG